MMERLVESLKRLFANGKVTKERLAQITEAGTITPEEKAYIMAGNEKGA
ncbi:MAG: hypothetical protein HFE61_11915 [Anaerotignum sp.]|nr:hypothetical protein [Anaerotignum sp.]